MPLPPLRGKGLQVDADIAHQITTSNEDRTIVQVAKVVSEVGCENFLALLLVQEGKALNYEEAYRMLTEHPQGRRR